ncbi:hypothetical protein L7F22_008765 [Adiantum nelumboides]|nr:hypothetical protein [Adiantum nelumboides]
MSYHMTNFPVMSQVPAILDAAVDMAGLKVNIHVLMALAAFASLVMGNALEGGLLLAMFSFSHIAEEYFTERALRDVNALKESNPDSALVLETNGNSAAPSMSAMTYSEVPLKEVRVSSYILVRAGEAVPVDGEVWQGRSMVTVEHLTGESEPIEKKVGDLVPGGARNLDGMLIIKGTKTWEDSTLARIMKLTEEAQQNRPKLQRWLDEFGERYSQAVIAVSVSVALFGPVIFKWPLISNSVCRGSVYRALGLMVAASPCALAAAPLAYATAVSSCASKGILLKGGHALDALANCDTVAFDKTGTLTTGDLICKAIEPIYGHVTGVWEEPKLDRCCNPNCEAEALAVAAAMEQGASHPIARSIAVFLVLLCDHYSSDVLDTIRYALEVFCVANGAHINWDKSYGILTGSSDVPTWGPSDFTWLRPWETCRHFGISDSVSDTWTEDRVAFQLIFAIEALLESIRVPVQDIEELAEQSEDAMGETHRRFLVSGGEFEVLGSGDGRWYLQRAVVDHSEGKVLPTLAIENFEAFPGKGLEATISGLESQNGGKHRALLGSLDYVASSMKLVSGTGKIINAAKSSAYGNELVRAALSVNEKVTLFHFEDKLRHGAPEVIASLKKAGMQILMLTGDHGSSANRVAKAVGIEEVHHGMKPEDKLHCIKRLSRQSGKGLSKGLIMVGDGVNDAPALAAATVGVVLARYASATAIAVADVLLLQDNIDGVPFVIAKAHQTTTLVKQSVGLALSCILAASLPSVMGFLPLWLTVLLHEGGTLLVCLNSVRALNDPRDSWNWQHNVKKLTDALAALNHLFHRDHPSQRIQSAGSLS